MSLEQAHAFIDHLLENPPLQDELSNCSSIEERLLIAQSNGYDVNIDDFKTVGDEFLINKKKPSSFGSTCHVVIAKSSRNVCQPFAAPDAANGLARNRIDNCHTIVRKPPC